MHFLHIFVYSSCEHGHYIFPGVNSIGTVLHLFLISLWCYLWKNMTKIPIQKTFFSKVTSPNSICLNIAFLASAPPLWHIPRTVSTQLSNTEGSRTASQPCASGSWSLHTWQLSLWASSDRALLFTSQLQLSTLRASVHRDYNEYINIS